MDRLDVFEVSKAGSLAPIKELADHVIISDWCRFQLNRRLRGEITDAQSTF